MAQNDYVQMPQNDLQQIEQIIREYESDPSRGLTHGVQKDAIQNGFGARVTADEIKACKGSWAFHFELLTINNNNALIFWDEGAVGLTGDILSVEDIEKKSADDLLGADHSEQRLSRFLTRFESGGNVGAGTFGRGKLIFQGASKDYAILVDSLRSDDNEYISFDRKIMKKQLMQQRIPYVGDKAKEFIENASGGILKPLTSHGTRITILNIHDEITEAFKQSFTPDADTGDYTNIFSKMIEETWWEIVNFGAKITLKFGNKTKAISITEPFCSLLECKNKGKGYYVYEKNNMPVIVDNSTYKIKHLRIVVAPNPIPEELREIWVQRKRMKIGGVSKGIIPHHKIAKNYAGYIILDPDLEGFFEEKEGPTHYGFVLKGRPNASSAISQVREIIRTHFEQFQQQMGLRVQSTQSRARQDMMDALKELNEQAKELGLPTDFFVGATRKDVEISIDSFVLPNASSTRVEIGDKIGPITYRISNNTNKTQPIKIVIKSEQSGKEAILLKEAELDLKENKPESLKISFNIERNKYTNGEGLWIHAEVIDRVSSKKKDKVSRKIWIGMDAPEKPQDWITITAYSPDFPRPQARRVELDELIRNIRFKMSSNAPIDLKINADLEIRKSKSQTQEVRSVLRLLSLNGFVLPALSEKEIAVAEVKITKDIFGDIFEEPQDYRERKCEIFFSVRAAENYPDIQKNKGEHLGPKKSIPFFCGIDPAGMSIFKNVDEKEDPDEGKRSWFEGDRATGYSFILNVGHASYKLSDDLGDGFRKYHIKEQMLFQSYLIATQEKIFKGPAEKFADILLDGDISVLDAARCIDAIVGGALNKVS